MFFCKFQAVKTKLLGVQVYQTTQDGAIMKLQDPTLAVNPAGKYQDQLQLQPQRHWTVRYY